MQSPITLDRLSDDELLRRLDELVAHSRRVEADLVAHIGEVERRRLYAREASPSMFAYCRERLHLSEAEAYMRIRVARAAHRHPLLLDMLRDGRLHLSGIVRLLPVLTRDNRDALLARATFCSKRQILELVAELSPRPDVPTRIRKLPRQPLATIPPATLDRASLVPSTGALPPSPSTGVLPSPSPGHAPAGRGQSDPQADRVAFGPAERLCPDTVAVPPVPAGSSPLPMPRALVEPLSPGRYRVQFTANAELHAKLERLRALMGLQLRGDVAAIIDHAVSETLARLEARRFAKTSSPRTRLSDTDTAPVSRHVPAAVRRAVRERDGARCGYVDAQGRRCSERDRLEFHHRHPFGLGGDHEPDNVGLLCPAHNQLAARGDYGVLAMSRHGKPRSAPSPP